MPARPRILGQRAVGPAWARMRATRSGEIAQDIAQRIAALGISADFSRRDAEGVRRLARALRAERRAARAGARGYDLLRHVALARMARRLPETVPAENRAIFRAAILRRRGRAPSSQMTSTTRKPAWPINRAPKS